MDANPLESDGIPSKRCPFCAELIPDTDRVCRYCNEYLDPSLRGKFAGGAAYWEGDYLKVPLGGFIRGTHCLICGRPGGTRSVRKTFRHLPRWLYLFLLILACPLTIVFIVVVYVLAHERQEIDVPVCRGCEDRWRQMTTVSGIFGALTMVALPTVFGFIGNDIRPRDGAYYGGLAGLLASCWGLFGLYALGLRRVAPTCRKIDRSSALLRLPNASLVQTAWEEEK